MVTLGLHSPEEMDKELRSMRADWFGFASGLLLHCDSILAVERRGLAMLFAYLEANPQLLDRLQIAGVRLDKRRGTVDIRPDAIGQGRIVVFDDMADSGKTLTSLLKVVSKFSGNVVAAVFCASRTVANKTKNGKYEGYPLNIARHMRNSKDVCLIGEVLTKYYEALAFPLDMSCVPICGSFSPPLERKRLMRLAGEPDIGFGLGPEARFHRIYRSAKPSPGTRIWVRMALEENGEFRAFGDFSELPRRVCGRCSRRGQYCEETRPIGQCNAAFSSELRDYLTETVEGIAEESGSRINIHELDPILQRMMESRECRTTVNVP
jgi:hypothetical protein